MLTVRRFSIVLGLALLSTGVLAGQERGIEIGLVGGLNRNTMTGVGPVDAQFAGQAGLYGRFQFGRHVSFRPEMSVSWKRVGTNANSQFPCDPGPCPQSTALAFEETTSMTWLEVPLLAQVSLRALGGGSIVPRFIAGPYVAVRLSCTHSTASNVIYDLPAGVERPGPMVTISQGCAEASGQAYGNGDAGYVLGAGLATRRFGIGLRWTRSLVATVPFSSFGFSPLTGGKQSTLALTLDVAIQ